MNVRSRGAGNQLWLRCRELGTIEQLIELYHADLLEASMTTSPRKKKQVIRKANGEAKKSFVPSVALAKTVEFDDLMMRVTLTDGRELAVPLMWFPASRSTTEKRRSRYEICGGGISLHWPALDEDISLAGLMAGVDARSA